MAMPSTPFRDSHAMRRRHSQYGSNGTTDTEAASNEEGYSASPRRLSTLVRNFSVRGSPRERNLDLGDEAIRRSSSPRGTPTRPEIWEPGYGRASSRAASPLVGRRSSTLNSDLVLTDLPEGRPGNASSPHLSGPRTSSPFLMRSLSHVPPWILKSERRRGSDTTVSAPASDGILTENRTDSPSRRISRTNSMAMPSLYSEPASESMPHLPNSRRSWMQPRDTSPARTSYAPVSTTNSMPPPSLPMDRAQSPGLHAFHGTTTTASSRNQTPVPSQMLGDEMPRSMSPVAMQENRSEQAFPTSMDHVSVRVEPISSTINMFGALQVSSHYSISGHVKMELPSCCDGMEVRSLKVHLLGYSMYVDSSARFSSVEVCNVQQELCSRPVHLSNQQAENSPVFEVGFDLFVPGWLPASFTARSASTFYNLQAVVSLATTPSRFFPSPESYASAQMTSANWSANGSPMPNDATSARGFSPLPPHSVHESTPHSSAQPELVTKEVTSAPFLIRIRRSRDTVPIPVAQMAIFSGEDLMETPREIHANSSNPFLRNNNPFRAKPSLNPFLQQVASTIRNTSGSFKDHASSAHQETHRRMTNRTPLRHFSHIPKIPLPVPIVVQGKVYESLPVKLTLSVPAHTNTHVDNDQEQAPLVFGLQVELDPLWAESHPWSDLRLCELEAMCVQMEKYSSSLSRSYCTAFSLPMQGDVDASHLPAFPPANIAHDVPLSNCNAALLYPYNRALLESRIRQQRAGTAPVDRRNHAERYRSYTVGPLPQNDPKGKRRQPESSTLPNTGSASSSSRAQSPTFASQPQRSASDRKKRSFTAPFSRFSMFGNSNKVPDERSAAQAQSTEKTNQPPASAETKQENPKASYVFEGNDGCGMNLTAKKSRLSFSLPMAPSSSAVAARKGIAQLLPDYESPHVRIRHKLKVKLRFGYGSSQAGINAGTQSLVMCVPVRFTESPPSEALAQAAPIIFPSSAQSCVPAEGEESRPVPAVYTRATHSAVRPTAASASPPYLPAYIQLFREDGSRLADDSETLPCYPFAIQPVLTLTAQDYALATYLEQTLTLATEEVREAKSAPPTSMMDTLNADDELFEADAAEAAPQLRVDDDMLDADMQQTTVTTGASGLDYDLELDAREMNGAQSPMQSKLELSPSPYFTHRHGS
ncbi:hypothetical protein MYAM1_002955 [Malassezia yamatoensis]|uniref:Uncharacterized protein n=1 Tax=Malassezia yamatoensis TaxID=253288 RepID=A0AAJ5YWW2_9BASI|nr:hypothetical protein MYAM1_002955 [Malassezia yamatoensis]